MNNRQGGGRRRGRNNNNGGGPRPQGGGRGGDSGNRIDSRARGNAAQLLEKYRNMARDAQLSGDRVMTEYHLQFADHYFRVLSDTRARQEEQRARFEGASDGGDGDQIVAGTEDEAEDMDELDAIDMIGRAPRNRGGSANGGGANGYDRPRDGRDQGRDRLREDRPRDDRPREERSREDRPRDDRPREERQPRGDRYRDERPREERPRDDRPREERDGEGYRGDRRPRREGGERPRAEEAAPATLDIGVLPPAIGIEPREEVPAASHDEAPAPKKRGRPRKVPAADSATDAA